MTESDYTDRQLFKISEEHARKINCQQAAIFGAVFMIVGVSLDYVVYPEDVPQLFVNRVITASLLICFGVLCRFIDNVMLVRLVVHMVAMLPIVSISFMIFALDGARSPYWAGLNLVILWATLLLRWSTLDSILNVILCLACYGFAIRKHDWGDAFYSLGIGSLFPFYFIFVTGAIASAATYFYIGSRFREFCLAKKLAATNEKLVKSNQQFHKKRG